MRKSQSKFTKPTPYIFMRQLTKPEFKALWSKWRSLDEFERINEFNIGWDSHVLYEVNRSKDQIDPLLIKSVKLAINIEHSEMLSEAA